MMPLQRACGAEKQVRNKLSNGPLRAQSKEKYLQVFCDVEGRRHLPGICWYPAERTERTVNQGGTADNGLFALDRDYFCQGLFITRAEGHSCLCVSKGGI